MRQNRHLPTPSHAPLRSEFLCGFADLACRCHTPLCTCLPAYSVVLMAPASWHGRATPGDIHTGTTPWRAHFFGTSRFSFTVPAVPPTSSATCLHQNSHHPAWHGTTVLTPYQHSAFIMASRSLYTSTAHCDTTTSPSRSGHSLCPHPHSSVVCSSAWTLQVLQLSPSVPAFFYPTLRGITKHTTNTSTSGVRAANTGRDNRRALHPHTYLAHTPFLPTS